MYLQIYFDKNKLKYQNLVTEIRLKKFGNGIAKMRNTSKKNNSIKINYTINNGESKKDTLFILFAY
ncbi:hypothetical protein A9G42_06575 [Gilliamella sp. Nev6-6]|jgi:hypothetical protein|nr:hypothetical protein A9G42_06575 [Gilliamella apicola]